MCLTTHGTAVRSLDAEAARYGHCMSVGGRARTRKSMVLRAGLVAGVLLVVALLLLAAGHWVLGLLIGVVAAVAVWGFLAVRSVR